MKKKTIFDVEYLLNPLYKKGKPFIIKEEDHKWVRKILPAGILDGITYYRGEKVFFDTLQTKVKPKKVACRWCNKTNGVIKFYILADNLEEPKAYHPGCMRKLEMEVIMKLGDHKAQINP